MADSMEGDAQVEMLSLMALAIIAFIPGLLIHSFIIVTNVNDWKKRRSVTSVDHIVTFLGISRMGIQCADMFYFFGLELLKRNLDPIINMTFVETAFFFFIMTNIWMTTLLLIVLCLKISNLRTRLFLYLRRVILPRTGHFIVALGLLSAFNSVVMCSVSVTEWSSPVSHNTTMDCFLINSIVSFSMGCLFSLFFYLLSSALLFSSLYHHTVKMKRSSNVSIKLETYYSAMKLVFFTFIYNSLFLICLFIFCFYFYLYCVELTFPYIFLDFLPVLHSSLLIYQTARLRSQMSKVLQKVKVLKFQRKDIKTRENIEVVDH